MPYLTVTGTQGVPYLTATGPPQAPYLPQLEHPVVVQRLLQLSSPSAAHTPMQLDVDLGLRVAFRHAARGHFHLVLHHCTHRTWQCHQQQYGLCVIFHTPQMATSSAAVRTVCHISRTANGNVISSSTDCVSHFTHHPVSMSSVSV